MEIIGLKLARVPAGYRDPSAPLYALIDPLVPGLRAVVVQTPRLLADYFSVLLWTP